MGVSKTQPMDWMLKIASQTNDNIIATPRGWELDKGIDKPPELLHAMSGIDVGIITPLITTITFQRKRNLSLAGGDLMLMKVNYVEDVTVVGAPTIGFNENGVPQVAVYDPAQSDNNTLVFEYTPTIEGPIDTFATALGGGSTITDDDGNTANQSFPAGFAAPAMTVVA